MPGKKIDGMGLIRGCWIDLFGAPHFTGKLRRIFGPALYLNLQSQPDHPVEIASVMVGPAAFVQLLPHRRTDRGGLWLKPNQRLATLSALKVQEVNSIRIVGQPPTKSDPGYSAFVRQLGKPRSQAARIRKKRRK